MSTLWLLALLLFGAALFFIWVPVLSYKRQQKNTGISQKALNIQAFQSQISELEVEHFAGRLETAEFEEIKAELERNLLSDVSEDQTNETPSSHTSGSSSLLLGVLLSVFAVGAGLGIYFELGRGDTLKEMAEQRELAERLLKAPPEERITILRVTAEETPDNPETWYALAQAYARVDNLTESAKAYEKVLSLTSHPTVMAEYAQMLFFVNGNKVTEQVKDLAEGAVKLNPENATALGLLGIDAFETEKFNQAIDFWQRAVAINPVGSGAEALRAGIAQARIRSQALSPSDNTSEAGVSLSVNVSLAENLLANVKPEATVFVFAKALQGPPMPLAVARLQVKDLPAQVELNDGMAMTPELTLSAFKEVELVARISSSGTPIAQPGDLQGNISPIIVKSGQTSIKILINNVVE